MHTKALRILPNGSEDIVGKSRLLEEFSRSLACYKIKGHFAASCRLIFANKEFGVLYVMAYLQETSLGE